MADLPLLGATPTRFSLQTAPPLGGALELFPPSPTGPGMVLTSVRCGLTKMGTSHLLRFSFHNVCNVYNLSFTCIENSISVSHDLLVYVTIPVLKQRN